MVPQQNETVGIAEGKRPEQNTFDEREDRGGGADAQSQGEDDRYCEAWRLAQAAKGEAEILGQHRAWIPPRPNYIIAELNRLG